jgi:leucyl aminopeptidase
MLPFYITKKSGKTIPIVPVVYSQFNQWLQSQDERTKTWLANDSFRGEVSNRCLIKNAHGELERVILGIDNPLDYWSYANLPRYLPAGIFSLDEKLPPEILERAALGFGLGTYQFTPYKKPLPIAAKLQLPTQCDAKLIENTVRTIFLVRDLINTPTEDMSPAELADAAETLAKEFGGKFSQIIGNDLLKQGYPTIYMVGKASIHEPRLLEFRWGNPKNPKVTLVGKGVCFDTGGLQIKPCDAMLLMKKDMAGAAHVLGLARMIMAMELPIYLRVLIPAVENAISGDAYHPGDVVTTRKGITVEITNTDAEGRLVLCDVLAEAAAEKPEIIIDMATLTGAANIALGPEIPAMYTPQEKIANEILIISQQQQDPVWQMPLYKPYRRYLESCIADILNASLWRYAGSITAALFLKEFVGDSPWVHFDLMAWNIETKLGRIMGGEAMALRTLFTYLQKNLGDKIRC